MTDINRVVLTGRLTANVEVRKTQSGVSVASFVVASNGRQDETAFVNCVAWRQGADFLGQYSHKGDLIGVDGRISTRSYERDGQKVYITEVIADTVQILAKKGQNQPQASGNTYGQGNTYPTQNAPKTAQNRPQQNDDFGIPAYGIDNGDLPF